MPSARATIATWLKAPRSFEHEAAQFGAIVFEQRGRPHGAGDDDGIVGQILVRGHKTLAGQLMQQPVGEIVEIVQAFAQIGVGLALQLGARYRFARVRPPLRR